MDPRSLPAYPGADYSGVPNNGMTLRDRMAIEAMPLVRWDDEKLDEIAAFAYKMADAMLKAREKK